MREVTLPSGATLKIAVSPFSAAKALYQAVLRELRGISLAADSGLPEMMKALFCAGFSSLEIEAALWECLKRCTYTDDRGELKVDKDTFEPESARQDYMKVCVEVAQDNIGPFGKSLFAEFKTAQGIMDGILKSRPPTTTS